MSVPGSHMRSDSIHLGRCHGFIHIGEGEPPGPEPERFFNITLQLPTHWAAARTSGAEDRHTPHIIRGSKKDHPRIIPGSRNEHSHIILGCGKDIRR